jgi:outer membrane receptor protein involved in Fe transport
MGLAVAALPMASVYAQDAGDQTTSTQTDQNKKSDDSQKLGTVVVTGSLIPKSQIETATPVITLTGEEMQKQGFRNVYDALKSLPVATGSIQDSQFSQGFTPGANTVSLLGLDPSFTLVLMNGKPIADYPFLYNSSSNFVDLNTIPNFMVDHIDIVPGNQSAIYGSAAIAGVINIITKQRIEGTTLDYRVGGYTDGGGGQQRLQFGGGHSWGNLDLMYGVELNNQNPVFFRQRSFSDSAADNPTLNGADPIAQRDRVIVDAFTGAYISPDQALCSAIGNLYNGTEKYSYRPGAGYYCGTTEGVGYGTMLNENKQANAYLNLKYQLNDNTQLYADTLFNVSKIKYLSGGSYSEFWNNGSVGYFYDLDSQHLIYLAQHIFAPEEVQGQNNGVYIGHSYVANFGIRGSFGSSDWNYDASYHRSENRTDSKGRRGLVAPEEAYFLGPQDGTDPYGYGYPAYHLIQNGHFWGAATPADYLAMSDIIRSNSRTYTQEANLTITNTNLFELPAGAVGFAGVAEIGNQYWDNPVDPRVLAGDFFGIGGTSGNGKRDRQALAAEINVPIFSMLTADASARYDSYKPDGGSSDSKVTYKVGLEFRPLDTLLFRANYATAFRAPDMGYVFSTGSKFFTSNEDYYNCRVNQGDAYTNCDPPYDNVQIEGYSDGNKDLKYITAKSFGYGVVWSPTSNFNVKLDYYNVTIDNEVSSYSVDTILQKEADCRLGHTRGGTPVDGNSPACLQFISQVGRNPLDAPLNAGALNSVTTYPINISNETVSGLSLSAAYRLDAGRAGDFTFEGSYNTTFKHVYKQFPDDPETDLLRSTSYYNQFKDIGIGSVTWDIGAWSTTLSGFRYGSTWSYDGSRTIAPWILYNATVKYNFSDDASLMLIVNNVRNSGPRKDPTYSAFPYYNIFDFNGLGRSVMAEFNFHFGAGKAD